MLHCEVLPFNQNFNVAFCYLYIGHRITIRLSVSIVMEMDGLNVGLELRSELLSTVWDSSLRMVRRHAITILIFHEGDGSP